MGKHCKVSSASSAQTVKRHAAVVAVAAGAVTTAGVGGAAAAQFHTPDTQTRVALASNTDAITLAQGNDHEQLSPQAMPQILSVAEFKPAANLADQLGKAVSYNAQRIQEDLANRLPTFIRPAEGVFTSGFELRWGTFHKGIDIANAEGTPILAVADGDVIDAGPASGFGQWVRIQHDDGTITVYGHMSTIDVSVGQRVKAGQKIAGMGSLGFSTGSHLHFEVHPAGGDAIDPLPWLAERGITF